MSHDKVGDFVVTIEKRPRNNKDNVVILRSTIIMTIITYPEIGDGNFNITHSHFIDLLLFKGS